MKWLKTTVIYESTDPETAAALISDIFQGFGLKGVILESTSDTGADLDWAENAASPAAHNAVIGFFPEPYYGDRHRKRFESTLCELKPAIINNFEVTYSEIDEEDWAESWKLHFHPVKITDRIVVRPGWQEYEPQAGEIIIELDPGMAFGTGTHPTTALCIRLVEAHMKPGTRFLDIGTGSGILMIAAAKTGATTMAGIDNDPVAVEVAGNNLLKNKVAPTDFTLVEADLVTSIKRPFDMIAANILAETICRMIPDIPPLLSPGGVFIASGIIIEKEPMVLEALHSHGFEIIEIQQLEGWTAIAARRPGSSV